MFCGTEYFACDSGCSQISDFRRGSKGNTDRLECESASLLADMRLVTFASAEVKQQP